LTGQPFRKAYLESLIGDIKVDDDQIRIKGERKQDIRVRRPIRSLK
jgi:hypothetical protein